MPTYVALLSWPCEPKIARATVRASVDAALPFLQCRGLHSLSFLPDEGECMAIMIATCANLEAVEQIAALLMPGETARIETMRFDDDEAMPAWVEHAPAPPPHRPRARARRRDYRHAILEAIGV